MGVGNKDIYQSVIKKPWGEEYCVFRGNNLSIWKLRVDPGKQTSLHCHPNKKTGLLLVDGYARINLIERSFEMLGPGKINIQPSIFHQTQNIGNSPLTILEVETPDSKSDLIRIKDSYGREGQQFEGESEWSPTLDNAFKITDTPAQLCNKTFQRITVTSSNLNLISRLSYIIILSDYAFSTDAGEQMCKAGDILTGSVFYTMKEHFKLCDNLDIILCS